jgi:hypothetical protein
MAKNLKQLIYNLRVSGVLFYSDLTEEEPVKVGDIEMNLPTKPSFSSRRY